AARARSPGTDPGPHHPGTSSSISTSVLRCYPPGSRWNSNLPAPRRSPRTLQGAEPGPPPGNVEFHLDERAALLPSGSRWNSNLPAPRRSPRTLQGTDSGTPPGNVELNIDKHAALLHC